MNILVCGIDEAGRGPLAGPVAAAAVILPHDFPLDILNDSKKLSEAKRLAAEKIIVSRALWGLAFATHEEIDSINILQATLVAMQRAFTAMRQKMPLDAAQKTKTQVRVIVDGNRVPAINDPCVKNVTAVVKADATVHEVMAASIIAKCARDRLMCEYAKQYPAYGYEKHKGYPTAAHRQICKRIGPSPIQRVTFSY
jgi:ribonuclease HII